MQVSAYLGFHGNCETAFKFYEECFGGKINAMMTYGETPMSEHTPKEWHSAIVHTNMTIGNSVLMGGDTPPGHYKSPAGFSVSLIVDTVADAERIFAALSEGGTVGMPMEQTFWAARFGMVTDRFGTPWMVSSAQTA